MMELTNQVFKLQTKKSFQRMGIYPVYGGIKMGSNENQREYGLDVFVAKISIALSDCTF
jgi:hypothetical protein